MGMPVHFQILLVLLSLLCRHSYEFVLEQAQLAAASAATTVLPTHERYGFSGSAWAAASGCQQLFVSTAHCCAVAQGLGLRGRACVPKATTYKPLATSEPT
jgi:hypothetical protein